MKKGILILLLFSSSFVHAQTLKDALFGGKLKNQPGSVIRKGDDLASKMDTTTRKVATNDTVITKTPVPAADSSAKKPAVPADSAILSGNDNLDNRTGAEDTATAAAEETAGASKENAAPAKNNNTIWKEYVNTVAGTLKTEVMPSKKIKRGSYHILVSYVIDTVGKVTISDVSVTPENAFLQQQIKDRLSLDTPQLTPVLSDSGTPRKANRRYSFALEK